MRERLEVETKIEYTQVLKTSNNNKIIRVKLEDWESKQKLKQKKNILKGEKIYIDDDLTTLQRQIQHLYKENKGNVLR